MSEHARPTPAAGPSPAIPLRYLIVAAGAFVLAPLGVVSLAPELARHYYQPRLIALTHLVTLGWITLAIMGASYQIVPIVLGRPVWSERLARWQLWILVASIAGMVAHFFRGTSIGLLSAAALLVTGIAMHLLNLAMSLRDFRQWTFTAQAVLLGYAGLALTAMFGLALGANRLWPVLAADLLPTLHAHVHLALLGFVAPMVFGVSARVYPMFLLASEAPPRLGRAQLAGLAAGVPMVVLGLLAVPALLVPGALAVTAAAAAHGLSVVRMTRGRNRPGLDWGLRFMLTGALFLVPLAIMGLGFALDLLSGPRAALAYAVLALGGWISLTIAGAMLKIVPFLVWYRVYAPRAGRAWVPTLAHLAWPRAEGVAHALLTAGVIALAMAVAAADVTLIQGAGVVLALGALTFGVALGHVLRHLAGGAHSAGLGLGVRLEAP